MPTSPPPRLVRWLLRLYPESYRDRYGGEIAAFVTEELRVGGGGPVFWLRLVVDHLVAARQVRRHSGRGGERMTMFGDMRWAVRSLLRARGFTAFAVLTLGLGVGATASVFTVVDRVLLRPFPWEGGDRLVHVGAFLFGGDDLEILSQPLLRDYMEALDGVEALVGANGGRAVLTGETAPTQVRTLEVSHGYFAFFDGVAEIGRLLGADDHAATGAPVTVLSYGFWTDRFGADPGVVGTSIEMDGVLHDVIGVLEPGFTAPQPDFWGEVDVLVPMGLYQKELEDGAFGVRAAARLAPGVAAEELVPQLTRIGRLRYEDPDGFVSGFGVQPLEDLVIGTDIRRNLIRVLGAVGLLLLIGCVNVASLLMTRASRRTDELRVRASLGATRGRLAFQLLTECALIALMGGVAGAAIAGAGVEFFRRNAPPGIPRVAEISLDPQALLTTLALALLTVALFGLMPVWSASRAGSLRPSRVRGSATRRDRRIRGGLILFETGLAVVLVVWSGLLSRDLIAMSAEDPGFRSDGLVAGSVTPGASARASDESRLTFFRDLSDAASAIPGVERVALATELPYSGNNYVTIMMPEGTEDQDEGEWMPTVSVDGDYFSAFGVRFIEGRPFDTRRDDELQLAVVNDAFVRHYWPDGRSLGRMIKSGGPDVDDEGSFEVVGVIADIRSGPGSPGIPKVYVDHAWEPFARMNIVLQTSTDPEEVIPALRAALRELDPDVPLTGVVTLEAVQSRALRQPGFYASIFASFGIAALLLALIGVYGTTAYATAARAREIGIRVALGEDRHRTVRAILERTTMLVGAGIGVGVLGALLAGRVASDTLLLIEYTDPLTYLGVSMLVWVTALLAAWLPARRLTRIDPTETLRREA